MDWDTLNFGKFLAGLANPTNRQRAINGSVWEPALTDRIIADSQLARRCLRIPLGPDEHSAFLPQALEDARTDGSRFGGMSSGWIAEGDTLTPAMAKFLDHQLDLYKCACAVRVPREALEDRENLGSLVERLGGAELGFLLDSAIFSGTGAGMPDGISTSSKTITVDKRDGQTAATICAENIGDMVARFDPRGWPNATWVTSLAALRQMGETGMATAGGLQIFDAPSQTLYGRPIIISEAAPAVGSAGDLVLCDLKQYALACKPLAGALSAHVEFMTDQVIYRMILRVNGAPTLGPVQPADGGDTVSPFVRLGERA